MDGPTFLAGTGKGLLSSALVAAVYYLAYLIIHPVLLAGVLLIPELLRNTQTSLSQHRPLAKV